MTLWAYIDGPAATIEEVVDRRSCLFCGEPLKALTRDRKIVKELPPHATSDLECDFTTLQMCQNCGWWSAKEREKYRSGELWSIEQVRGGYASLRSFDVRDMSEPIAEVRDFLAARFEMRKSINPRLLEETVGSVFHDLGYTVVVTAYSSDEGIDVILSGVDGALVGVQVKRYRNAIKAEQIRSLAGALVLGGYTKGIFVTTSVFQPGAERAAQLAAVRGVPIELVDADRFYDALKIAQLQADRSHEEWLDVVRPKLKQLSCGTYMESYYTH